MFCEMDPPIGDSISRTSPGRWTLGSLMICEKVDDPESKPADAIASWQDDDGTFYLRKSSANELSGAGDVESDRIHVGGTSGAVWCLGKDAFCKVHAWCEGLELEANTMRFVREKAPSVPIPELVHSWIDHDLNRTFLITKRVPGQILERVWPRLSPPQRTRIAEDIAGFCATLAANTSSRFETVTGCGVYEPRLMESAPDSYPTWKPRTLGPLSQEPLRAYLTKASTEPAPDIDPLFHFYHADLGPTNIMLSEDGGRVTGIIDWESAAYYPRFWIATKPATSGAFYLECETDDPKLWGQLLGQVLETHDYERADAVFRRWYNSVP
ncbi:kinase-like domain-containing protein [Dichotomopilus funicola]|uniref:Kinase-like domain-containing protein n=1 Tax=Dichotomopilus funicola TaxID=1934379 RepID=A0AAN6V201_9PEZI|nr:kinase-like domain-containing protein [Dichotomopilus funicola]